MRSVKDLPKPFIIADVGSNFCVSSNPAENLVMARRHIYDAARCGVSAVKFQLFTDKELYGMEGPNKYALPREWLLDLASYCTEQNVEFMCTAFSEDGYQLVDQVVNIHKVASAEMKHVGILNTIADLKKPALISTGGAHNAEVFEVDRYLSTQGFDNFTFLECVARYPAEPKDYNLELLNWKGCAHDSEDLWMEYTGISDHTRTDIVALVGVGKGATIFEKHFKSLNGIITPDSGHSLNPDEMSDYVYAIKEGFAALGDGVKRTRASERDMTLRGRRRLKVILPIKASEKLIYGTNFGIYRSLTEDATAGSPEQFQIFDGGTAKVDLHPGDPVWTSTVQTRAIP